MPDLDFQVLGAEAVAYAAAPTLRFKLRATEGGEPKTPIHSVILRCQIRIEPALRRYEKVEQERLFDLFGRPQEWNRTLRPMLWTHAVAAVHGFTGQADFDLPVPCTADYAVAASHYFHALADGEIPLCFLFSGTIFYSADDTIQAAPISWSKEATFRLPAGLWKEMMDLHFPNSAWLCVRRDLLDRLHEYKTAAALPTLERALEALLEPAALEVS